MAGEKALNSVDHSVYGSDLSGAGKAFLDNAVQAGIDNGCGASGLAGNNIFFHAFAPLRVNRGIRYPELLRVYNKYGRSATPGRNIFGVRLHRKGIFFLAILTVEEEGRMW